MASLIHDVILDAANRAPGNEALVCGKRRLTYAELAQQVTRMANGLQQLGLAAGQRAAVYLEKNTESVVSLFGTAAAGGAFVPVNPLLKAQQVSHILRDCNVGILVTSTVRYAALNDHLPQCPDLHTVILTDDAAGDLPAASIRLARWADLMQAAGDYRQHRRIDSDMAAILYTSGSTGTPKGVVLSHRNLMAGAYSVASYLQNTANDRILVVLPLSFDYGLSQLTTAFLVGACAVLADSRFPKDILQTISAERITGLAGVPPLWQQLAGLTWNQPHCLRYMTNSGGAMPATTLEQLRAALPSTEIYLMYGLTESFRSTYLPPSELDRRPGSIGRAIPNADVLVVREDGTACAPFEHGELVHRGPLVSLGYWNDREKTAERFRLAPGRDTALTLPEIAVWSGDTVYADEDGYLYFVGRRDDMIKVSGYRISPTEIEDILLKLPDVLQAAVFGVPHPSLGQAIVAVVHVSGGNATPQALQLACKQALPAYMVPAHFDIREMKLPTNPNGKLDRSLLRSEYIHYFDLGVTP